jgi:hypothetical protein
MGMQLPGPVPVSGKLAGASDQTAVFDSLSVVLRAVMMIVMGIHDGGSFRQR